VNAAMWMDEFAHACLDGDIVDRVHRDYDRCRRVWNAMADRRPQAIVRARSVADVQKIVAAAAKHDALLAVRGGGHSIPGLSTCDDGIVLDLSAMNAVAVDRSARRAEVLGGALLGDLDAASIPLGLAVPAGVVSHTGVAGLTLGGGMGWLSRRFGLTIDSLLAADIVTADGQLRQISAEAEPDLFWAIRGGGGNFGVVIKFTFRMHPLGPVLIGSWMYPFAESGAVLRRYRDIAEDAPRELTTSLVMTSTGLQITALWSGAPDRADDAVEPLGAIGRTESGSVGEMTFLDLQRRSDDHMGWNRRYYSKGGYFQQMDDHTIDRMVDCVAKTPTADSEIYVLQLGGAVCDIDDEATPYTGRKAGFYWIVSSGWDHPADDERIVAWSRMAAGRLAEISMRGNYVNEQGDFGKEVAIAAYGEGKYRRLSKLKARYDPANLFRLNQNIEPKP
jgi:FAD/FMN-containing dehydrogenase